MMTISFHRFCSLIGLKAHKPSTTLELSTASQLSELSLLHNLISCTKMDSSNGTVWLWSVSVLEPTSLVLLARMFDVEESTASLVWTLLCGMSKTLCYNKFSFQVWTLPDHCSQFVTQLEDWTQEMQTTLNAFTPMAQLSLSSVLELVHQLVTLTSSPTVELPSQDVSQTHALMVVLLTFMVKTFNFTLKQIIH